MAYLGTLVSPPPTFVTFWFININLKLFEIIYIVCIAAAGHVAAASTPGLRTQHSSSRQKVEHVSADNTSCLSWGKPPPYLGLRLRDILYI